MACPFYRIDQSLVERRKSRRDGQSLSIPAPWCAHLHSPVTQYLATQVVGGNKLPCKGELVRCAIGVELRPKL